LKLGVPKNEKGPLKIKEQKQPTRKRAVDISEIPTTPAVETDSANKATA